ncbi:MAG: hypothetical protein SFZ24_10215 [Planctomycetota bacterium]|nr:hypothetical protein [Planctomycetota bacterium]
MVALDTLHDITEKTGPDAAALYVRLALDSADDGTITVCLPDLAAKTSTSVRQLSRLISRLIDAGTIAPERRTQRGVTYSLRAFGSQRDLDDSHCYVKLDGVGPCWGEVHGSSGRDSARDGSPSIEGDSTAMRTLSAAQPTLHARQLRAVPQYCEENADSDTFLRINDLQRLHRKISDCMV